MSSCELTICTSLILSESFPCSSSRYRFVIKLVCGSINSRYSCFASSCGLFSAVFARKLKLSSYSSADIAIFSLRILVVRSICSSWFCIKVSLYFFQTPNPANTRITIKKSGIAAISVFLFFFIYSRPRFVIN